MTQNEVSPAHPKRHMLLWGVDISSARGLEIGPLASPALRRPVANVVYVDHADTASLRAKYAGREGVDVAGIVDVDVVWSGGPLPAKLLDLAPFDYAFAAHVIEHVPDMIGWLSSLATLVRPDGRLCLAIPDKRFTFDYLRRPTTLADVLDAHLRGNVRPMPAQVFDHHAQAVVVDREAAWQGPIDPVTLVHYATPAEALELSRQAVAGAYIDVHCWVFTPHSLMTLLAELAMLGLLPWRCAAFYETEPCALEMLLVLERLPDGADIRSVAAGFSAAAPPLAADPSGLAAELAAIRASTSWRVTEPLRAVKRALRRLG
jgi:SAM-dependent methyltransferase